VSRRHARVVAIDRDGWEVEDLGSRNGTYVNGARISSWRGTTLRSLRLGETILLPTRDTRRLRGSVETTGGMVIGPTLRRAWRGVEAAAGMAATLHLSGESGTGKTHAAAHFHAQGPHREGPFVAVDCAGLPPGRGERLLFGGPEGAGFAVAAAGGTLFLSHVDLLDAASQTKLLRLLETGEVVPERASSGRPVDLRFCSASERDLGDLVTAGQLRADLFFRIGRPMVTMPPLRDRPEDIAYLINARCSAAGVRLGVSADLIEACLQRRWPGNVRELHATLDEAAMRALGEEAGLIGALHLGVGDEPPVPLMTPASPPGPPLASASTSAPMPTRAEIEDAMRRERGRVAAAARRLGLSRIRLRRWLERNPAPRGGWR
jgi:DNA-binding NtrC family response regulator